MAEGESFEYCDSDEEVFIGKVTEKEWKKAALFGQNYYSPAAKSTPGSKVFNKSTKLPDVLTDVSTSRTFASVEEVDTNEPSKHCPSANSSFDVNSSIVVLEDKNNSIQTISDDESFLLSERLVQENDGVLDLAKEDAGLKNAMEILSHSSSEENVIVDYNKSANPAISSTSELTDSENNTMSGTKSEITENTSSVDEDALCEDGLYEDCTISSQTIFSWEDTSYMLSQEVEGFEDINKTTSIILTQDIDALEDNNRNTSILSNQDLALENPNDTASVTANQEVEALEDTSKTTFIMLSEDIDALEDTNKNSSIISNQCVALEDTNDTASIISNQEVALRDANKTTSVISNQDIEILEDINNTSTDTFQPEFNISQHFLENKSFECNSHLDKSYNEDNIGAVKELVSGCFYETNKCPEMNSPVQSNMKSTPIMEEKNLDYVRSSDVTNQSLCEAEYVSLNDSVLEISHGSSLASPLKPKTDKATKTVLDNVYEDISCDGESQFDSTSKSLCAVPEYLMENEDLHMSVDENDYQNSLQMVNHSSSGNTLQPSLYNSCSDKFSCSSYYTAFNTISDDPTPKPSLDSFNSYRDTLNRTGDLEDIDVAGSIDIDTASKNETSFEMIVQERQNSFTPSTPPAVKNTNDEQVKSKVFSKLPVYNHGSKSLIKPPKLNITSHSLKSSNYKWAKNFTKSNEEKIGSSKGPISAAKNPRSKIASPFPKVGAAPDSQQKNEEHPNQMVCTKVTNTLKIPIAYKTPAKTPVFQAVGMVKSELKTPSVIPSSIKNPMSSEKKMKSKIQSSYSQEKNRYKNVISPIRLYISGTPSVLQEKVVPLEEVKLVVGNGNKNTNSHLPVRVATPLTSSRAVQKLNYEKKSPLLMQQENVDPNYSRDTLPPRALENSAAVFMKEPEPPKKHLPKMGGNLQKLLDTPRPKVVLHQGRVKNSPTSKGVLVPSFDVQSPEHNEEVSAARVSIRVVKTAENSNDLK